MSLRSEAPGPLRDRQTEDVDDLLGMHEAARHFLRKEGADLRTTGVGVAAPFRRRQSARVGDPDVCPGHLVAVPPLR